jgi:hypothetical protein
MMICAAVPAGPSRPATAQTAAPSKTPAKWKAQALLGDHLRIFSPPEAIAEGPSRENIMGTAPDTVSLTRIRIPIAGTEIVVQARSMKALAPKDMPGAMKAATYLAEFKGEKESLALDIGGGWKAAAVMPRQYRYWPDSYLLAYAWISDPDGLLYELVIGSWIKDEAYPKLSQTAAGIVRSLAPGLHFQGVPRGTASLNSEIAFGNGQIELVIDLDGKYAVDTETGLSFVVHRITELVEMGSDGGEMGIYLGRYPHFNREASLKQGARAMRDQESILGQIPEWLVHDGDNSRKQSTLIEVSSGGTDLKCHLFISGTPEQVDALVRLAHTLRIRSKS